MCSTTNNLIIVVVFLKVALVLEIGSFRGLGQPLKSFPPCREVLSFVALPGSY